ncbi:unnamed protein product [Ectocarpus sp. 8 AP-2014]
MEDAKHEGDNPWDVRMVEATPATLHVWRVIGDESGVAAYAAARAPSVPATIESDWSAMYFQLSPGNAVGTLGYRWDQGYPVARLVQTSLPLAACGAVALVVDDTGEKVEAGAEIAKRKQKLPGLMVSSDVPGAFKAAVLKSRLGVPPDEPLLPALGQRQPPAVLVCRESVGEWEVAVPHNLLRIMARGNAWEERRVAEFRTRAGITAEARLCGPEGAGAEEGPVPWHRWRDGDEVTSLGVAVEAEGASIRWLSEAIASPVVENVARTDPV